jgi:hypothetical protein
MKGEEMNEIHIPERPEFVKASEEVERLTRLRNRAERGTPEHGQITRQLLKAQGRLNDIQMGRKPRD